MLKATFVRSAAHYRDLPPAKLREVCILGRSNVGKSSFLNHVFGQKGLAKVSRKPGKTTLANLYEVSDGTVWVDLPGYGYATASHSEKDRWSTLIRTYCEKRENLMGAIWLLDIRHPGTPMDHEAWEWLLTLNLPLLPILTKSDKLSRNQQKQNQAQYRREFSFADEPILYSIDDPGARERFEGAYDSWKSDIVKG